MSEIEPSGEQDNYPTNEKNIIETEIASILKIQAKLKASDLDLLLQLKISATPSKLLISLIVEEISKSREILANCCNGNYHLMHTCVIYFNFSDPENEHSLDKNTFKYVTNLPSQFAQILSEMITSTEEIKEIKQQIELDQEGKNLVTIEVLKMSTLLSSIYHIENLHELYQSVLEHGGDLTKERATSNTLNSKMSDKQLKSLYDSLKGEFISDDTLFENLRLIFSGATQASINKINWIRDMKELAYLIGKLVEFKLIDKLHCWECTVKCFNCVKRDKKLSTSALSTAWDNYYLEDPALDPIIEKIRSLQ